MFQEYYKLKAKSYLEEMEKYNIRYLEKLNDFNDAVKKYKKFKQIYDKASCYINKLPHGYIESQDSLYLKIKNKLDRLYNEQVITALKKKNENESLNELEKIKIDLNNSYGYGFDNFISQYHQSLYNIITNHKIIYMNYKTKIQGELEGKLNNSKDPLYKEVIEYISKIGKVSTSLLQRKFRLGYNRAINIMNELEKDGLIGPQIGNNPRTVLINYDSSRDNIPEKIIDFVALYGTDYENMEKAKQLKLKKEQEERNKFINEYVDNAQSYFDEKGLNIKFNRNKRIDLTKLNNLLFTNTNSEDVEALVNKILSMSVPNELKFLLIDYSRINLYEYNGLSNLLAPVIYDYKKAKSSLVCLKTEMNKRYELFLENKVKNITTYNEQVNKENKLPYIVVVINEIFEMLKFENSREIISELLLNCKKAGIIIICFSKFNKKNIQLLMLEDLFEIHNKYSNNFLEYDRKETNLDIENIDNDMDGFDFEKYASKLLEANGFKKIEVTQCSNDFGVDIIAYKDEVKYAIQCKKYSSPVGIKAVQEVIASKTMNDCHVAVVLTNNTFTKSAQELAEKNSVLLWDRNKLVDLINNVNK